MSIVINNSMYYYGITWRPKDGIYFTSKYQNIWNIKSNGDSVT